MQNFRLPATALVVHDPYFSLWSFQDKLNCGYTGHWTGRIMAMGGFVRVDGQCFVFLGDPTGIPTAEQISCTVLPTRTIYIFEVAAKIRLTLTFVTPAFLDDLELLSRPVTYLDFDVVALDKEEHDVKLYFDASATLCVDSPGQKVHWGHYRHPSLDLLAFSHDDAHVLERSGDDLRIDWGQFYLAVPRQFHAETVFAPQIAARKLFADTGTIATRDDLDAPKPAEQGIAAVTSLSLGLIGSSHIRAHILLAYDDVESIEYFKRRLVAYWRRNRMNFSELLTRAENEYPEIIRRCENYDHKWMEQLTRAGGENYALICAGAYRQAIGAHKLVADVDGTPLFFSKENFSNGCIATVDVTYPSAPLFLAASPELLKGMLMPILDYAMSPRWKFPFAPHDLGVYPLANGQKYGGGEDSDDNQMPIEECGNMLILAGALLKFHSDVAFVRKYYAKLNEWAVYLADHGYDPANQLCTDDFAGFLAHNTNLSLKTIIALGAFSQIAAALGDLAQSEKFIHLAQTFAAHWQRDAASGDHYRLAFDCPDSWSQKYNLVWDRLLDLNLFPKEVAKKELQFYRSKQNLYGLPLDNRQTYTKLDWIFWSACLTGNDDDFQSLLAPVYRWVNETTSRVPLTDWYDTVHGRQIHFQARSVVGGLFIKLLYEQLPQ